MASFLRASASGALLSAALLAGCGSQTKNPNTGSVKVSIATSKATATTSTASPVCFTGTLNTYSVDNSFTPAKQTLYTTQTVSNEASQQQTSAGEGVVTFIAPCDATVSAVHVQLVINQAPDNCATPPVPYDITDALPKTIDQQVACPTPDNGEGVASLDATFNVNTVDIGDVDTTITVGVTDTNEVAKVETTSDFLYSGGNAVCSILGGLAYQPQAPLTDRAFLFDLRNASLSDGSGDTKQVTAAPADEAYYIVQPSEQNRVGSYKTAQFALAGYAHEAHIAYADDQMDFAMLKEMVPEMAFDSQVAAAREIRNATDFPTEQLLENRNTIAIDPAADFVDDGCEASQQAGPIQVKTELKSAYFLRQNGGNRIREFLGNGHDVNEFGNQYQADYDCDNEVISINADSFTVIGADGTTLLDGFSDAQTRAQTRCGTTDSFAQGLLNTMEIDDLAGSKSGGFNVPAYNRGATNSLGNYIQLVCTTDASGAPSMIVNDVLSDLNNAFRSQSIVDQPSALLALGRICDDNASQGTVAYENGTLQTDSLGSAMTEFTTPARAIAFFDIENVQENGANVPDVRGISALYGFANESTYDTQVFDLKVPTSDSVETIAPCGSAEDLQLELGWYTAIRVDRFNSVSGLNQDIWALVNDGTRTGTWTRETSDSMSDNDWQTALDECNIAQFDTPAALGVFHVAEELAVAQ